MYQFIHGRLYPDTASRKISFALPNGFWIETEPEAPSPDSFTLVTPDRKAHITIMFDTSIEETTYQEIAALAENYYAKPTEKIFPINIGTLNGHGIICPPKLHCHLIRLDISRLNLCDKSGNYLERMEIIIKPQDNMDLKKTIDDTHVKMLLDSIQIS